MDKADILELAVQHMQHMSAEHIRNKNDTNTAHRSSHAYSMATPPQHHAPSSMPNSPSSVSPCSSRSSTPEYNQHTQFFPETPATLDYHMVVDTPTTPPSSNATPIVDESMWRPW